MEKHKFASISLTLQDRAILSKFSTHRISKKCTIGNFQKKFPLPKNGGHFEFFPKMEKHKFASISLTMPDRAILSKFSTHRVYKKYTFGNFQKIFLFPKMAAILNFPFYCVNTSYPMDNLLNRSAQTGPPNTRKRRPVPCQIVLL